MRPLSGDVNAAIGSNIFGGIIDEINFMARLEQSKNAVDGGIFDQANEMYNSIVRRRKSRFMQWRALPAWCAWCHQRGTRAITDRKQVEARDEITRTGKTSIFVYDRPLWEIKPEGTYGKERFKLFLGDVARKPRILEEGAEAAPDDAHLVMEVPDEFRSEFTRDILSAIRDIAGSATFALHPFIVNTEAVRSRSASVNRCCRWRAPTLSRRPSILSEPHHPAGRAADAHVDLGLTGDSAGVAVGWVEGFRRCRAQTIPSRCMPVINST